MLVSISFKKLSEVLCNGFLAEVILFVNMFSATKVLTSCGLRQIYVF